MKWRGRRTGNELISISTLVPASAGGRKCPHMDDGREGREECVVFIPGQGLLQKLKALCAHMGLGFRIASAMMQRGDRKVRVRRLSKELNTSPTRVSRALKEMSDAGLTEQSPADGGYRLRSQELRGVFPAMAERLGMRDWQNNEASG